MLSAAWRRRFHLLVESCWIHETCLGADVVQPSCMLPLCLLGKRLWRLPGHCSTSCCRVLHWSFPVLGSCGILCDAARLGACYAVCSAGVSSTAAASQNLVRTLHCVFSLGSESSCRLRSNAGFSIFSLYSGRFCKLHIEYCIAQADVKRTASHWRMDWLMASMDQIRIPAALLPRQ